VQSKKASRRRHDAGFKAKVLAACNEPGASVAAVALSHGLNANLVRNWLVGRGLKRAGIAAPTPPVVAPNARFLPMEMSLPTEADRSGVPSQTDLAARNEAVLQVEVRRGASSLTVRWPSSAGADCAAWLRELAAALLK
jgi:transposase